MKDNNLSATLEDYLEAIYHISQEKLVAQANRIAEYLNVSKSSVSWALKQLSQKGLINYIPYEAITLTNKGRAIAKQVVQRHKDIKNFLTEVLAINESKAESNACRMEHVLDKEVLKQMKQFEAFLEKCPRAGREWMKGLGIYCQQGKSHENCTQCISDCLEQAESQFAPKSSSDSNDKSLPKLSKNRDHNILQRLKEVQHESGHPFSSAEISVAETFMNSEKHYTLAEMCKLTRKIEPKITSEIVEKVLAVLCEHKIARSFSFRDQVYYEHLHPESHHDHLFCVKCGAIVEFFDPRIERLQTENARRADFRLLRHTLNVYGVCHECIKSEAKTRNLSECLAGEMVKVVRITAENRTAKRIADMGLSTGSIAEVISDDCGGKSIIVTAGNTRIMLDNATAQKIRIVPVQPGEEKSPQRQRRRRHRHTIDQTENA